MQHTNKEIARDLRRAALLFPEMANIEPHELDESCVVYVDTDTTLKCLPYRESIEAMADKLGTESTAYTFKDPTPPRHRDPGPGFRKSTYASFITDGELENAYNYHVAATGMPPAGLNNRESKL